MKKNRTMRLAALLLVLTLITSCFVGGTFAKYTTTANGNDSARVAKWGVVLTAASDIFKPKYDGESSISVKADDNADVVAPGTTGTATIFTIDGAPEVDVKVTASLGTFTVITLPKDDYKDWTEGTLGVDGKYIFDKTYDLTADYKPVKWTLTKNDTAVDGCTDVNLDVIDKYLKETLSGFYHCESDNTAADAFESINGTYKLTWNWYFDDATKGTNNKADTTLGQIAAGKETAPGTGYVANETFNFSILVEQIDVHPTPN